MIELKKVINDDGDELTVLPVELGGAVKLGKRYYPSGYSYDFGAADLNELKTKVAKYNTDFKNQAAKEKQVAKNNKTNKQADPLEEGAK